jgi:hypothetical protein
MRMRRPTLVVPRASAARPLLCAVLGHDHAAPVLRRQWAGRVTEERTCLRCGGLDVRWCR